MIKVKQDQAYKGRIKNVIKEAHLKEEADQTKAEELPQTEDEKPSIGKVMFSVFKSKQEFKSFIKFIKNGFKS